MMEGEAAWPPLSVGARCLLVGGHCWPCALAGRPWGVVLSVGIRHAWVASRHCIWEGHRHLWGILVIHACVVVVVCGWGLFCPWALLVVGVVIHGGGSSLLLGVVSCGHWVVVLIVGGGRPLWVLGVVRGAGSLSVGAGLLFFGAGLSIVRAGAHSHEHVVRGCWFVVCGHGGDVSCAVWSPLASLDGEGGYPPSVIV